MTAIIKECEKCHGSGWVRTTSLRELNRPDRCWDCGGSGLEYHPFHASDTPGKCSYCEYPIASWVHQTKEERK